MQLLLLLLVAIFWLFRLMVLGYAASRRVFGVFGFPKIDTQMCFNGRSLFFSLASFRSRFRFCFCFCLLLSLSLSRLVSFPICALCYAVSVVFLCDWIYLVILLGSFYSPALLPLTPPPNLHSPLQRSLAVRVWLPFAKSLLSPFVDEFRVFAGWQMVLIWLMNVLIKQNRHLSLVRLPFDLGQTKLIAQRVAQLLLPSPPPPPLVARLFCGG